MFYNILDQKRIDLLPKLLVFKKDFYLAGGTALALHLGHRDSIDFDFFSQKDFDTAVLFTQIENIFQDFVVQKVQDEKNTLTVIIDEDIKLSFFTYKYPLLDEFVSEEYLNLGSVSDIACMKLSAIVSRSTMKDYVDLYFILQDVEFSQLLDLVQQKFPPLDFNLIFKSLVYFDDIIDEPIVFKNNYFVSLEEIKSFFQRIVVEYIK